MAGLDLAETARRANLTAWVADTGGRLRASESTHLPVRRPALGRVEFDPTQWWAAARSVLAAVVAECPGHFLGLTVASAPAGFVLTDGRVELGPGVAPSDQRGAGLLAEVQAQRQLYAMTRHRPSAELTLPKLLAIRAEVPRRWADARRLLFLPDWLIWRLTGVEATEVSYACTGQLAHVSQRSWAGSLLDDLGVPRELLAPLVEAGAVVGRLREPLPGLPAGLPVIAGCGARQLAAAGVGAAHPGAVCVLADTETTLLAAADFAPLDPRQRPRVATHAPRDTWAVDVSCGSPAALLGWLAGVLRVPVEELYAIASSARIGAGGTAAVVRRSGESEGPGAGRAALVGMDPAGGPAELAAAVLEGYAFAVRATVADLEEILGARAQLLVLTGPDAHDDLAGLIAAVTGRDVARSEAEYPAATAAAALVAAAVGADTGARVPAQRVFPAGDPQRYDEPYVRYLAAQQGR